MVTAGSGLEEGAGGAGGYFHGIIPLLSEDPRVAELVLYVPSWYERAAEWRHEKVRVVACDAPTIRPLRVAYEQLRLPMLARRDRVDVLFSPGNCRPLLYPGVNVLGLHAIQYFLLPDDIGRLRKAYLKFTVPRSVRTADLTITATETLRKDTIGLFDPDPERIVVVPMGSQPWVTELLAAGDTEPPEPHRLPNGHPYVMCISRLYALKNHRRLIEAFGRFVEREAPPHDLVIVGGEADVTIADLEEVAREAGVGDRVHFLGRVAQEEVPSLYEGAAAIAYVSLYETFGHPVLEAFATGTPLLTSKSGAAGEVAGGAAVLADPEDVDDIAAGLRDVLLDEPLRERLVRDGHARVREFSWEACASGTLDALERAVAARRNGHTDGAVRG
jgi:glycosyltransferase involved in cell wall biosynthesis